MHASGLSGRQWSRWVWPAGLRPVAVDLHGCGSRAGWSGPWPFRLVEDLRIVLEALEAHGPAHLVGHSYGGALALFAAAVRPDLARRVAVYEPPLFGLLRTGTVDDRALLERGLPAGLLDPATEGTEAWLEAFVDWWNGPGAWRGLGDSPRTALLRARREVWGQVIDLLADARPLEAYRSIEAILLLRGEGTPAPVARALERLASLPQATLERLEGLPHMGPLLAPDRVASRVAAGLLDPR